MEQKGQQRKGLDLILMGNEKKNLLKDLPAEFYEILRPEIAEKKKTKQKALGGMFNWNDSMLIQISLTNCVLQDKLLTRTQHWLGKACEFLEAMFEPNDDIDAENWLMLDDVARKMGL